MNSAEKKQLLDWSLSTDNVRVRVIVTLLLAEKGSILLTPPMLKFISTPHDARALRQYIKRAGLPVELCVQYTPYGLQLSVNTEKNSVKANNHQTDTSTLRLITNAVIEHLNNTTGQQFRANGNQAQKLIAARLKENFTPQDFIEVINKKYAEWGDNEDMARYLRPITLFGTKMESYLGQKTIDSTTKKRTKNEEANKQWAELTAKIRSKAPEGGFDGG